MADKLTYYNEWHWTGKNETTLTYSKTNVDWVSTNGKESFGMVTSTKGITPTIKQPWSKTPHFLSYDPETEPPPVPGTGHHAIIPINKWKIGITQLTGPVALPPGETLIEWVQELQALPPVDGKPVETDTFAIVNQHPWDGTTYETTYRLTRCRTQQPFTWWGGHPAVGVGPFKYWKQGDTTPPCKPEVEVTFWPAWMKDTAPEGAELIDAEAVLAAIPKLGKKPNYEQMNTRCSTANCYSCLSWAARVSRPYTTAQAKLKVLELGDKLAAPYPVAAGWKWEAARFINTNSAYGGSCAWCGGYRTGYYFAKQGHYACPRCYLRYNYEAIAEIPAGEGHPKWMKALEVGVWEEATLSEKLEFAEAYYENGYRIPPGRWRSEILSDMPDAPVNDDPDLLIVARQGSLISGVQQRGKLMSTKSGHYFILPCMVCGGFTNKYPVTMNYLTQDGDADYIYNNRSAGFAHPGCYSWLTDQHSEFLKDEGLVRHTACGEFVDANTIRIDPPVKQGEDGSVQCKVCSERYYPGTKAATGSTCVYCRYQARVGQGQQKRSAGCCLRCSLYARQRRGGDLYEGANKIKGDFPLGMALADFYMLADLATVDDEAGEMFKQMAAATAEEFKNYAIIACGGELRHWPGSRTQEFWVVYESEPTLPPYKDKRPRICPRCFSVAKKGACEKCESMGYTRNTLPVKRVMGTLNSQPIPGPHHANKMETPGRVGEGEGFCKIHKDKLELGKEVYEQYTLLKIDPKWRNRLNGSEYSSDRSAMWARFKEWCSVSHEEAVAGVQVTRDWFLTGKWREGYGGYWWGLAADTTLRFLKGEMPAALYVDTMFGLQHNGGTLFNKIYNTFWLQTLLDLKRETGHSALLAPWCSAYVLDMYEQVTLRTNDPDRLAWLGAIKIMRQHEDVEQRKENLNNWFTNEHSREAEKVAKQGADKYGTATRTAIGTKEGTDVTKHWLVAGV